ncbi:hypothetical protein OSB04_005978 [Centaurea solstitialis]|uniref:Uncharacterized protein n=1 Tax=Centaurea solstitialis TaxID=347529 RepID=A0AA38TH23_9ASTR|nr:hypothetical protein OSB04_005978 [Centaurea solstitialis]
MLLAVEGGGFFSSSASGYSKGLTLLLLGKKSEEEKSMRVRPWNEYQLVDQEPDPDLQLASHKNLLVRGCASFLCFGRAAAGLETPSPLKVGPTRHQNHEDVIETTPDLQKVEEKDSKSDLVTDDGNVDNVNACSLKSSLKRPTTASVSVSDACKKEDKGDAVDGDDASGLDHIERRVQWTDVSGGELFVIREFEPSEHSGSDDEYENGKERSCSCRLM